MRLDEWTDEQSAAMVKLWNEGLSGSQIGAIIGMTKNAVVGRVYRMRKDNPKLFLRHVVKSKPRRDGAARLPRGATRPARLKRPSEIGKPGSGRQRVPEFIGPGVRFMKRALNQCAYISGSCDGPISGRTCCGAPVHEGSSYCHSHYSLCYKPARDDNDRPDAASRFKRATLPKIQALGIDFGG